MATKYHISDDGMPGPCRAQSIDSCPKTQAGDSFHGTAEEAQAESQRRFVEEFGELPQGTGEAARSKDEVALSERKKELSASLSRHQDPTTSEAERSAIKDFWNKENCNGAGAVISRIEALEFQEGSKDRARISEITGVDETEISAALRHIPEESSLQSTLGARIAADRKAGIDLAAVTPTHTKYWKGFISDLRYGTSPADRDYIINEVPFREHNVFAGEKSGFGLGDFKGLVKVHRAMVKKHGEGTPSSHIANQLPADRRNGYIEDRRRDGVGSYRPWGQPSDSIQNVNRTTADMLAQHVIDRYGAENAEKFWSKASATNSPRSPRAKLSQVFRTMREFDKEMGIKG